MFASRNATATGGGGARAEKEAGNLVRTKNTCQTHSALSVSAEPARCFITTLQAVPGSSGQPGMRTDFSVFDRIQLQVIYLIASLLQE